MPPTPSHPTHDWLNWAKRWIAALRREYDEGGLALRATSLVYTSLLSLAPLLAVSFSVLKAFGVHNQLEPLLLELLEPLGDKSAEITRTIIGFVESIGVGVLGMLGVATLFYTVISLLEKIESTFNHIWRVATARSFARRFSDYLSVILVGPVLVFSAIGLMASTAQHEWVQHILAIEPFGTLYYLLTKILLPYVFISVAFSFVYVFIPNTRVQWSAAVGGGLVAGVTWKLVGSLFAAFVSNSASYSAIYSSFAAIILFMLWLYISWLILLLGGAIAFHIQYPRYLHYGSRHPKLSIRCIEQLALELMYLIGLRYYRGESAIPLHTLADMVNLPWESVGGVLSILQRRNLLVVTDGENGSYQLARDTDAIRLQDILSAIRSSGDVDTLPVITGPDSTTALDGLRDAPGWLAGQADAGLTLRAVLIDTSTETGDENSRVPAA
ncbi:YihY family inner membrane protein [Methylolobus aquaticus]|nr:YihY family inner membrane protein [Methylolobus aquaticus]